MSESSTAAGRLVKCAPDRARVAPDVMPGSLLRDRRVDERDTAGSKPESGGPPPRSLACLSIDVEEYFHAEAFAACVSSAEWSRLPRRAAPFVERIAGLLRRHECRATFFVLGWVVESLAPLLRQLVAEGHEIACHGDRHVHLSRMTPRTFRDDLCRARGCIEDALGVRPRGYRAPTFSVMRATAWALDVIIEEGFVYDASIFPIRHDRYGVPDAPLDPFWAVAPSGRRIVEFPPLTVRWGPARLPVAGGGYLRLLPGVFMRRCVASRLRAGRPAMLYVHPWELDAGQPRFDVGLLSQWRHRVNLRTTEAKLERLLRAFGSERVDKVLDHVMHAAELPICRFSAGAPAGAAARIRR